MPYAIDWPATIEVLVVVAFLVLALMPRPTGGRD